MTVLPQEPHGDDEPQSPDSLPHLPQDVLIPDDLSALFGSLQPPDDLSGLESVPTAGPASPQDAQAGPDEGGLNGLTQDSPAEDSPAVPDVTIPDDISSLTAPGGLELAALMTPLKDASMLAALCSLCELAADAFPTASGAIAALHGTELGGKVSPEAGESAAHKLTRALPGLPIVLLTRADGQLTASRYVNGQEAQQLAPGLLLSSAEDAVVDIFTGQLAPQQAAGVVSSSNWSVDQAQAYLSRFTAKGRRRILPGLPKRGARRPGVQSQPTLDSQPPQASQPTGDSLTDAPQEGS